MKRTRLWTLLALAVLGLLFAGPPLAARAANGIVTAPCDEAAFTTALNAVQSSGGGTLTFDCGAVTDIVFSASKTITSTVTIDGGGVMTLSGGNNTRHFFIASGAALTLTRLTVSRGHANGDGGAIFNDSGRLIVDQSTFRYNQTTLAGSGGAIVSYGPLTITASLFENNQGGGAGAVYPRFAGAVTYIANSTFRDNQAAFGGGALGSWDGAPLTITNAQFISNTAQTGGAIYNFGPAVIRNSLVLSNTAAFGDGGGGIYNVSTLHLEGVTVRGNRALASFSSYGGGLTNASGTAVITATTFSANRADYSEAILQSGTLTMTNSTIAATEFGIYALATTPGTSTYLRFVTIAGDTSWPLVFNGTNIAFLMRNVLFSNPGGTVCDHNQSGPFMTSQGNNLASDNSCYLTQLNDHPNTPALLGPLANNGGPTQTMLPQANSEAVDNGACQGYAPTDQRGIARPQGLACDIGAVEVPPTRYVFLPLMRR